MMAKKCLRCGGPLPNNCKEYCSKRCRFANTWAYADDCLAKLDAMRAAPKYVCTFCGAPADSDAVFIGKHCCKKHEPDLQRLANSQTENQRKVQPLEPAGAVW